MTLISIDKDLELLTMTVTVQVDATVERAWELWNDPRQLERWWGPPMYPATVEEHDLKPGGRVTYFMTGPEGDRHRGYWRVREVEAPRLLVVEDGFADESGIPVDGLPVTVMEIRIEQGSTGGSRMTMVSTFPSLEALEELIAMGMEEGLRGALGQIEEVLAG